MRYFVLILLTISLAQAALRPEEEGLVKEAVHQVIKEAFPELEKKEIKFSIYEFKSDAYFFVSNFKWTRLFGSQHYRIGVNPIIFSYRIPYDAFKSILVHELQHTLDYRQRGVLPIAIQLLMKKHRYRYERRTDLQTILRGYGPGLASYRRWQYPLLSERDLRIKKKNYLTDLEINFIVSKLETKKERIVRALRGYTPKNLEEWVTYLHQ